MKTKEDIQAKIQALKVELDLVMKARVKAEDIGDYVDLHNQSYELSQRILLLEWVLEDSK